MNAINFERWHAKKVLHSLPEASVIILDTIPCHCKQEDKRLSRYEVKAEMIT
jgi:hypothetical protein